MKKFLAVLTIAVFGLFGLTACDAESKDSTVAYNYISAEDTARFIKDSNPDYAIIDIQLDDNFNKHHLKGAIATHAYPADTDALKAKLKDGLEGIADNQKIIIVCPGGKSGATNSVDYYRSLGIDNERLLILQNGQNGWPDSLNEVLVTE